MRDIKITMHLALFREMKGLYTVMVFGRLGEQQKRCNENGIFPNIVDILMLQTRKWNTCKCRYFRYNSSAKLKSYEYADDAVPPLKNKWCTVYV